MAKHRRKMIHASDICWSMSDSEILMYGLLLIKERYTRGPLAEIVNQRLLDVRAKERK